jgi:hypothetical protein
MMAAACGALQKCSIVEHTYKLRSSDCMQIPTTALTYPISFQLLRQKMRCQQFIATAVAFAVGLSVPANTHPGEVEPTLTSRQLEHRQAATNARHAVVRNCDGAIRAFEARRRAKRSRSVLTHKKHSASQTTSCAETSSPSGTSTANVPTYTTLQNVGAVFTSHLFPCSLVIHQTTCVLTPEATEGPYFIVCMLTALLPFQSRLMNET